MKCESQRIPTTLLDRVAAGASAPEIAEAALAIWMRVHAALAPVIGDRGVAALYKRSLSLTRKTYPWFEAVSDSACEDLIFGCLVEELSQQSAADAAVANGALLQTVNDLLATLVGSSLTRRLLEPVWTTLKSGAAAQDRKA